MNIGDYNMREGINLTPSAIKNLKEVLVSTELSNEKLGEILYTGVMNYYLNGFDYIPDLRDKVFNKIHEEHPEFRWESLDIILTMIKLKVLVAPSKVSILDKWRLVTQCSFIENTVLLADKYKGIHELLMDATTTEEIVSAIEKVINSGAGIRLNRDMFLEPDSEELGIYVIKQVVVN